MTRSRDGITSTPEKLVIGMDVGSTTVKAVVIDPTSKEILWSDYQRHLTKQPATEKLEGEITVESERGQGTTLRMSFPSFAMAPELASPPRRSLLPKQIATA